MIAKAKTLAKENKLILFALLAYLLALIFRPDVFFKGLKTTGGYLKEMIEILPAVFVISGLIDVWVSRETIIRAFGSGAGLKGKLGAVLVGSISAGPIYAAFPVTQALLRKGASLANIVVILSAWAVVKAPMLVVESKFLGFRFMLTRYLLTLPGIMLIGYLTEKAVNRSHVLRAAQSGVDGIRDELIAQLPGHNCGSCGYKSCGQYAEALAEGEAEPDLCRPGGGEVAERLREIL